jgi:site-specific DNA recombinase
MSNAADRRDSARDALSSEEETDKISSRAHKGIRGSVRKGRPAAGRSGDGFRRIYDPNTGELLGQEIDEERAAVLRDNGDRVLAGEASSRIAKDLNKRGIRSANGGEWNSSNLRQSLLRPALAGFRVRDGEIVGKGTWPAIIEPERWFKIRDHFDDPTRRTQRTTTVRWLMVGIAICHHCNKTVVHKRIRERHQYTCPTFKVGRKQALVDSVVQQALFTRLSRDDAAELFRPEQAQEAAQAAKNELATLKARLSDFYAQAATGALSATGLVAVEGPLLVDIEKAEKATKVIGIPDMVVDLIAPTPTEVEQRWNRLEIEQKRIVIRAVMRVTLGPAPAGGRPDRNPVLAAKLARSVRVEWLTAT